MKKTTQKALLMVDVQNDFCPGGKLPVPDGDKIVPLLNKMARYARKCSRIWWIYASCDYHPKKTDHFNKWPPHCIKGTKGADFHPDLDIFYAIFVAKGFRKDEDAYSDFDGVTNYFFPGAHRSSLEKSLRDKDISEIYVGGLATDYCVKYTVIDALKLGFKVYLLKDACRAVNLKPTDEADAIAEMKAAGKKAGKGKFVVTTTRKVLGK